MNVHMESIKTLGHSSVCLVSRYTIFCTSCIKLKLYDKRTIVIKFFVSYVDSASDLTE